MKTHSTFLSLDGCEIRNSVWQRVTLLCAFASIFVSTRVLRADDDSSIRFHADVDFAQIAGETLRLNLAHPKSGDGPFPTVVCIHGGGFSGGRRQDYDELCRKWAARGYVAATIDYRLSPKHRWPAHIHDCKAAVRWLRANADQYAVDRDRIGAMGSSAGGHLSQFMAVTNDVREFDGDHTGLDQSSKVQCVAAWAQASDFTREYGVWKEAPQAFRGFLGAELTAESRRLHVRASPLFWVTPNSAPTLLVHGTADQDVLPAQTVWIYERLASAEVDSKLVLVEGGGHGLIGEHLRQAEQATFDFFDRVFRNKK